MCVCVFVRMARSDVMAERLVRDMAKLKIPMTEYNYDYMVKVLCHNGRAHKAEEVPLFLVQSSLSRSFSAMVLLCRAS